MPYKSIKIFTRRLEFLIEARNKNVAQTARAIGVEPQTVWAWLKKPISVGIAPEPFDKLLKFLEVRPDELKANGHVPAAATVPSGIESLAEADYAPVPEWPIDVRAGHWVHVPVAELNYDDPDERRVIDTGRFRLRIIGDCMAPSYRDGQRVEFKIVRVDHNRLQPGIAYVVCRNDETATFKRFVRGDGEVMVLAAENQRKFPGELFVPWQEVTRVAEAVDLIGPVPESKVPKIRKA